MATEHSTDPVVSSNPADVGVAEFASGGESVGSVPVLISYGIIERFSEGLYSSPNKTFEELITNSYDAGAEHVWVYLPGDFASADASLVVIDDGESMDLDGLKNLWRIGESSKRSDTPPPGRRKPVGKFGIGKLATYVLASKLTYIVHRDSEYLAVTMDYGRVSPSEEMLESVRLSLDVVKLTRDQAIEAVAKAISTASDGAKFSAMLGDQSTEPPHWTAAVLTELKDSARLIQIGRLRWILRTALPLNPGFALSMNDEKVESAKLDGPTLWNFEVGTNEDTLPKTKEAAWGPGEKVTFEIEDGEGSTTGLKLPHAGRISGTATLYEKPLERGKSEAIGRSHGFFVRVRGRLINLDDEDFALGPELRHGTLTRFHMEVNADDLDDQVASARETLKESAGLSELKSYLLAIFNKARSIAIEQDQDDVPARLSKNGRLADPPPALSQGPLRRMLRQALSGDSDALAESMGMSESQYEAAEALIEDGKDVVESVLLEKRESSKPFILYDPSRQAAILNQAHPFVSNYIGGKVVAEPMKLLGLAELLSQAYLLDENVPAEVIARVVKRRDSFLRALTSRYPRSAHVISHQLQDATNNEDALEDAVGDALELLGFDVIRLGGSGHGTDGIATARLGRRDRGASDSYSFTYDAKSTKNAKEELLDDAGKTLEEKVPGRVRADTARTSILKVHRQQAKDKHELDVEPSFTLLVAPDFQAASEEGQINLVCRNDEITAIRVADLARLVELFALQGLNPLDLRELFDLRTPDETQRWVKDQSTKARVPRPPVAELVACLVENSETRRPITHDALGAYLQGKGHDLSVEEIEALIRGLSALAPKSVYSDDRVIALNATPSALYGELRQSLDEFDTDLVKDYLETVPEDEVSG